MKRPCRRLRRLVPLGLLALPPILWLLLLMIIPTDWARGRIVARLNKVTGRSVRLEALRVGPLGGIRLTNLAIGAPQSGSNPWLTVAGAEVNVNLLQLFNGHIDPTEIRVDGINLRVRRRKDGTLEISDLLQASPDRNRDAADPGCPGPTGLEVWVSNANVEVLDEPTSSRLLFRGVEGRATCVGHHATVHELKGNLNGGPFELTAQLDRTGLVPSFEGQIRAREVALTDGTNLLRYLLAPVFSGTSGAFDGRLALDLYIRGQGANRDAILASLVGHGNVVLDPIQIQDCKLVGELAPLMELPAQGRIGAVSSRFAIKDRRISNDDLTVSVGRVPIAFTGWTGFDGQINYRLRSEILSERLPNQARDFLSELSIDLKELNSFTMQGDINNPSVALDGVSLDERTSRRDDRDRRRIRELGRKLRDRILR